MSYSINEGKNILTIVVNGCLDCPFLIEDSDRGYTKFCFILDEDIPKDKKMGTHALSYCPLSYALNIERLKGYKIINIVLHSYCSRLDKESSNATAVWQNKIQMVLERYKTKGEGK